jgi:hypothetical protein
VVIACRGGPELLRGLTQAGVSELAFTKFLRQYYWTGAFLHINLRSTRTIGCRWTSLEYKCRFGRPFWVPRFIFYKTDFLLFFTALSTPNVGIGIRAARVTVFAATHGTAAAEEDGRGRVGRVRSAVTGKDTDIRHYGLPNSRGTDGIRVTRQLISFQYNCLCEWKRRQQIVSPNEDFSGHQYFLW